MLESKALARLNLCVAITVFALLYAPLGGLNWQPAGTEMYAHFINVGQADATLLEFPCGAVLVDAGSQDDATHPRRAILEMLRAVLATSRSAPITIHAATGAWRFQDYTVTKRLYATGWDGDIAVRASQAGDFRVLHTN